MLYRVCEDQRIALSDEMRQFYAWQNSGLLFEEGAQDTKVDAKKKIDKQLKELVAQLGAASVAGGGESTVAPNTPYLHALAQSLAAESSAGSSRASSHRSHRSKSSSRRERSKSKKRSSRHRRGSDDEGSEDDSSESGSSDDTRHGKHRKHHKHRSSHHQDHHRHHRH